ncbi:MAG: ketopantoate reductase family protein [Propionibacteriaceae bacterium]|nr:ketopantoate reductase family protein [Propionibacteriaceae bacterium]
MTRISIIGLGAMGASYAAKLHGVPDTQIRVIASGERAERLRRDGVIVNGVRHDFEVVSPDQDLPAADLVIVGVKYTGFVQALEDIRHHMGDQTIVLSLLNGITSEAEIAAAYPTCHPLLSITFGVDAVRHGQEVTYSSLGIMEFGEASNTSDLSWQAQWVARLFDAAGLAYEIPPDMTKRLWWKFMINTGVNQVTAVLECPYAVVQDSRSPAHDLMIAAQREVVAVAQARGIRLDETDIDAWITVLNALGPRQYTSMAQDVLAHRPTEAEIFSGAMRRMGDEEGVPVPVNTCLHQILLAKEIVWRG